MNNLDLLRQHQSIKSLIDRTSRATWEDIQLQGHWGRYLCVLAAGLLENGLREVYTEFARSAASPHVANFARKMLENIYNPKAQRFIETARAFDQRWARELEDFLENDGAARKNSIDSIMANRHQIAHGRTTSISVVRVRDYLDKAVEVIDFIESQCLGAPVNAVRADP